MASNLPRRTHAGRRDVPGAMDSDAAPSVFRRVAIGSGDMQGCHHAAQSPALAGCWPVPRWRRRAAGHDEEPRSDDALCRSATSAGSGHFARGESPSGCPGAAAGSGRRSSANVHGRSRRSFPGRCRRRVNAGRVSGRTDAGCGRGGRFRFDPPARTLAHRGFETADARDRARRIAGASALTRQPQPRSASTTIS